MNKIYGLSGNIFNASLCKMGQYTKVIIHSDVNTIAKNVEYLVVN